MIQDASIVCDNCTPDRYNAEDQERGSRGFTVRAHVLSEILRNAQRWVRGYQSPESKAKKFGELLDCLLLTPNQWPQRYCVLPADAPRKPTKAQINAKKPSPESVKAIEWWADFERNNPGEVVSQETNGAVHAAMARLHEDKLIAELLGCSARQVMIVGEWEDKATGLTVPLKCLIDVLPPNDHPVFSNSIWDLKTTQNASPFSFRRDAQKYCYHIQGAFYLDLFNAATEQQRSDFGHIVIENYHPYEFRTPPPLLTQRFLNLGRLMYQKALGIYCNALATGQWPSYDQGRDWPLTDCDDWMLSVENVFAESEPEETEDMPEEEKEEIIP